MFYIQHEVLWIKCLEQQLLILTVNAYQNRVTCTCHVLVMVNNTYVVTSKDSANINAGKKNTIDKGKERPNTLIVGDSIVLVKPL